MVQMNMCIFFRIVDFKIILLYFFYLQMVQMFIFTHREFLFYEKKHNTRQEMKKIINIQVKINLIILIMINLKNVR